MDHLSPFISDKNDGGHAFPSYMGVYDGMSTRQYAAIHLKVPDSGVDWLDEMITKAKRDDFAGQALRGVIKYCTKGDRWSEICSEWTKECYIFADTMLAEKDKE